MKVWKSIKDKSNNKLINDKAGDGNTASNWTSSSETNDNDGGEVVKYIKPTYVIKLIEEDDKSLPKLLLQVAAAPSSASTSISSASNKQRKIIYFLSDASLSSLRDKFFVNSSTGELFVLKPLDRDQPTGKHVNYIRILDIQSQVSVQKSRRSISLIKILTAQNFQKLESTLNTI